MTGRRADQLPDGLVIRGRGTAGCSAIDEPSMLRRPVHRGLARTQPLGGPVLQQPCAQETVVLRPVQRCSHFQGPAYIFEGVSLL
eukprot:scaffold439_cov415-Prasinococcus_capsulatus_cf.AAC.32